MPETFTRLGFHSFRRTALALGGPGALDLWCVSPFVDHDSPLERDDDRPLLIEAGGLDREDANVGARLRLAPLENFARRIDRIPLEDGGGKPDFIPPEVGEYVLGDVAHALPGHQGEREGGVDEGFTELRLRGKVVIHVNGGRVLGKERKPQVVSGSHGATQRMFVDIAYLEILEEASPPAFSYGHLSPSKNRPRRVDSIAPLVRPKPDLRRARELISHLPGQQSVGNFVPGA